MSGTKRFVLYWLPLIILMSGLFFSSSQPYQKQDLRPSIKKHINEKSIKQNFSGINFTYHGEVSVKHLGAAGFIEFFIPKAAHFGLYFLMGFFMYQALWANGVKQNRRFFHSLLFVVLYAASDELHQMYTSNRTPLFADIILDSLGGAVGIGIGILLLSFLKPNRKASTSTI